jgi:hypothetical protein
LGGTRDESEAALDALMGRLAEGDRTDSSRSFARSIRVRRASRSASSQQVQSAR